MASCSRIIRATPSQKLLIKEQPTEVVVLENPDVSVVKSVKFIKQLTIVALSSIVYLRGIFPADAFVNKKLAGHQVYVLKGSDEIPGTRTLIKWIKSASELIHSHHLRRLMLVIQKDTVTLEVYTLSFSYNHDEIYYNVYGEIDGKEILLEQSQGLPEDIAKAVRQLVRCILTHATTLQPLPNDCELSVKLFIDEETPKEEIPEFFLASKEDVALNFPGEVETMKLGKVETKFSTFAVSCKSVMNGENDMYGGGNPCEKQQEDYVEPRQVKDVDEVRSLVSSSSQMDISSTGNKEPENDSSTTNLSEKLSEVNLREKRIDCICESSEQFDDTIKCVVCCTYQHKTCYKLLESHEVEFHICVKCHNPDQGNLCSVPELFNDINRKESALFRQALMYCSKSSQVSCKRLMIHLKIPRKMAEKIFKQLDTDGCLEPVTNRGYVRSIMPDFQQNILGRYFSNPLPTETTNMEVEESQDILESPVSPRPESDSLKRQQTEDEDNLSPDIFPQSKRRKILTTTRKLKKYCQL